MIPHRLEIKNFLSYGADIQTIDFRPYHLIYLSGKNGHGKSALLDAITWALWGHARKITNAVKPDQGLLRLGTTHMMVLFDFQVADQIYRVKREFMQTNAKQIAYLEFGLMDEAGAIIPLTDKTIRATQEVIERTIRLDYESFSNSAFLRQGHANEFSQKSPKDRKEILSTILGLHQFDHLKRRALERIKGAMDQRHALVAVQATLAAQLQEHHDITRQVQQFNTSVQEIKEQEQMLMPQKQQFDHAYATHTAQQKEYEFLQFKYEQEVGAYKEQCHLLLKVWKQWRLVHAQQLKIPHYKELEAQKKMEMQALQHYQQVLAKRLIVQEKIIKGKEELQERERALHMVYAQEIQQQEVALERLKFEKQSIEHHTKAMTELQKDLELLHDMQSKDKEKLIKNSVAPASFATMTTQFEKRRNVYQQYIAKANWLKTEYESIGHKKEVAHGDDPSCPLCEQNLSAARRKFLAQRFVRQERLIMHQLKRLQLVLARLKQLLLDQHAQLEKGKDVYRQIETGDKELQVLQQKMTENHQQLQRMEHELRLVEKKIQHQELQLKEQKEKAINVVADDKVYKEKKEQVHQLTAELTLLVYDEKEHAHVQQRCDALEKKVAEVMTLNHEIMNQQGRVEHIAQLVHKLKEQKKQLANKNQLHKQYTALIQEKQRLDSVEKYLQDQMKLVQEKKEKVREEHGRIKTKQELMERIQKEHKKNQESLEKLAKEIEDYQIIAAAAGKDGIQALLIEEAIPEIEQEANYLLSKLTNNQSHIFIESLRDLKSGGSKETLDINISDPSGIRPYEMFSGGEAFRIDFSLRIAISKLLARRAGTALQTLIIDEGFGSQDEEGLSLIMDALYKVQDDFEKVIVVSHLPTMRDQFPVHFVVEKGPSGSRISIVEQG